MLQGENRDTRFLRNAVALEYALDEGTALFAQGELFADKSLIDVSVGAFLFRRDDDALRVMLTAVDWTSEKSRVVEYERAPYAAMLSGAFGDDDGVRLRFELGSQLPFTVRELDDGERLSMQRHIASATTHWRLAAQDVLVAAIEAEWTDKDLRPLDPAGALVEDFERTFAQARVEWWRDAPLPWSVGVMHTHHDEDGVRPNDPASSLRTRRREWFGILRTRLAAGEKLSFEPQLFAGIVDDEYRDAGDARDEHRFEGKLSWNTRWDFNANAALSLLVSFQLDEPAFGGGGAQFVARF